MINLDVAWGVQIQILQAQAVAERHGLSASHVRTWMTRPMWKQLCHEIKLLNPIAAWQVLEEWEKENEQIDRIYCGSKITIIKGKRMISISAHPRLMGKKK